MAFIDGHILTEMFNLLFRTGFKLLKRDFNFKTARLGLILYVCLYNHADLASVTRYRWIGVYDDLGINCFE
jgi:hypothetical protein